MSLRSVAKALPWTISLSGAFTRIENDKATAFSFLQQVIGMDLRAASDMSAYTDITGLPNRNLSGKRSTPVI